MTGIYDLTEYEGALDPDVQLLVDCPSQSPRARRLLVSELAQKAETLTNKTLGTPTAQSPVHASTLMVGLGGSQLEWMGYATAAWTPGSIAASASATTTVSLAGAQVGDVVIAQALSDHDGCILTARVSSDDTVRLQFFNATGSTVILAATTVNLVVMRF